MIRRLALRWRLARSRRLAGALLRALPGGHPFEQAVATLYAGLIYDADASKAAGLS
jgi:hypothetical protein